MVDWILNLALAFLTKYPWFAVVASVMGMLRMVMKPLMSLVRSLLEAVKGKDAGDKLADGVETSGVYKALAYVLDWFASVKVGPQAK